MGFIGNTRQNLTNIPAKPLVPGGRHTFDLPKVGFLSRLFVNIEGTMNVTVGTGTAAISERLAYNLIKRIRVVANSGTSIFDVSGYGTYLINRIQRGNQIVFDSLADAGTDALVYAAGVANGDNTWKLSLEIPIAINSADPIGLIMLQNNSTQITVDVDLNPEYATNGGDAPIVVTGNSVASMSGTVGLAMEYFTAPREKENYPAINVIHQWLEQKNGLTAAGAFNLSLLRGNTYMRLAHIATINNALNTTAVEKLRILYNQAESPYDVTRLTQLMLQRQRYGNDLPKGTFVHDWYTTGNGRDFINSANVTEFQSEITIATGTSITAAQSHISTLSEQLIRIA